MSFSKPHPTREGWLIRDDGYRQYGEVWTAYKIVDGVVVAAVRRHHDGQRIMAWLGRDALREPENSDVGCVIPAVRDFPDIEAAIDALVEAGA
jgi:hypothetical protein